MNGIVEKIGTSHSNNMYIDCGDSLITIDKRGTFDSKQQYSWTYTAPSSGPEMEFESYLITETEIKKRIETLTDGLISNEMNEAIKLFFA